MPGVDDDEPPRAEWATRRRRRRHRDAARRALARCYVVDAVARPLGPRPVRPGRRRDPRSASWTRMRAARTGHVPHKIAGDARNQLDDELQWNVEHTLPNFGRARELERLRRRRARIGTPSSTSMDAPPTMSSHGSPVRCDTVMGTTGRSWSGAHERSGRRRDERHRHRAARVLHDQRRRRVRDATASWNAARQRDDHRVRTARAISRSASRCSLGVALVVQLLSLAERHRHLRHPALEVELERNQRQPLRSTAPIKRRISCLCSNSFRVRVGSWLL